MQRYDVILNHTTQHCNCNTPMLHYLMLPFLQHTVYYNIFVASYMAQGFSTHASR